MLAQRPQVNLLASMAEEAVCTDAGKAGDCSPIGRGAAQPRCEPHMPWGSLTLCSGGPPGLGWTVL